MRSIQQVAILFAASAIASCGILANDGELAAFANGDRQQWVQSSLQPEGGLDLSFALAEQSYVVVSGTVWSDGEVSIDDSLVDDAIIFGDCSGTCADEILRLADDAVRAGAGDHTFVEGFCGSCDAAGFIDIFAFEGTELTAVAPSDLGGVLGAIDTPDEVMLRVGAPVSVRRNGDDWSFITWPRGGCFPADTTYTLWSMTQQGQRTEVETYLQRADPDAEEYCP